MYLILQYPSILVNLFSLFQRFLVVLTNFIHRFLCIIFLFCYFYLCFKALFKNKQKTTTDFILKQKERVCDLKNRNAESLPLAAFLHTMVSKKEPLLTEYDLFTAAPFRSYCINIPRNL